MEFGTAVGGFIGSPLLAGLGGRGLYFAFGTVVLAIVAITALIQKRLPSEQELSASAVRQERHRATWVIRAGLPFFRRTRFCNQHREVSANTPGPEDCLVPPTYSSVRTFMKDSPGGIQRRPASIRRLAGRLFTVPLVLLKTKPAGQAQVFAHRGLTFKVERGTLNPEF
jgi:hypothetical protein